VLLCLALSLNKAVTSFAAIPQWYWIAPVILTRARQVLQQYNDQRWRFLNNELSTWSDQASVAGRKLDSIDTAVMGTEISAIQDARRVDTRTNQRIGKRRPTSSTRKVAAFIQTVNYGQRRTLPRHRPTRHPYRVSCETKCRANGSNLSTKTRHT